MAMILVMGFLELVYANEKVFNIYENPEQDHTTKISIVEVELEPRLFWSLAIIDSIIIIL